MLKNKIDDLLILITIVIILTTIKIPFLNTILSVLIILIYTRTTSNFKDGLGFKKQKNIIKTIGVSLFFAISIISLSIYILLPSIEFFTNQEINLSAFKQIKGNINSLILFLTFGWVIGGFFEEIIFRGFFITKIEKMFSRKISLFVAIIFPSVFFGYLHSYQGITGQILTGFVGLFLALIFVFNKKNIWVNILTHGFINTFTMVVFYYDLTLI